MCLLGSNSNLECRKHPRHSNSSNTGDFQIEDYFSVSTYQRIIEDKIKGKKTFRDYQQMPKAKQIIEKHYKNFNDEDFAGFRLIIDAVLEVQSKFHQSIQPDTMNS